ncbi:hypothetical protein VTK73DRAFT_6498 [Phialemonium thermophilum]|uniref:Uncharacterized protein n=1 Tax=Phialemonium thermophilum TaxID=223376 RepID=A0ABR3UZB4_9PEZI
MVAPVPPLPSTTRDVRPAMDDLGSFADVLLPLFAPSPLEVAVEVGMEVEAALLLVAVERLFAERRPRPLVSTWSKSSSSSSVHCTFSSTSDRLRLRFARVCGPWTPAPGRGGSRSTEEEEEEAVAGSSEISMALSAIYAIVIFLYACLAGWLGGAPISSLAMRRNVKGGLRRDWTACDGHWERRQEWKSERCTAMLATSSMLLFTI